MSGIQDDVKAILSSAIRKDEAVENNESFYSNGLDGIDQSSVISNR